MFFDVQLYCGKSQVFVPDNNHTTQENTGGVWFFIAATPKHHGRSVVLYCGNAQTPNRGQQSYKEKS